MRTWRCAGDERTCEPCAACDGMEIYTLISGPPHPDCQSADGCRCVVTDENTLLLKKED